MNETTNQTTMSEVERTLIPVTIEELKSLDTVFLSEEDKTPYLVLDTGHPFILIENKNTHFAYLYRPTNNLYKYV